MSVRVVNDKRIRHIQIKPLDTRIQLTPDLVATARYDITRSITAQIVDMTDKAIVDAVVQCARDNGVDEVWLLDKKFVLDALREKMERENTVNSFMCDEHDVSGLLEE